MGIFEATMATKKSASATDVAVVAKANNELEKRPSVTVTVDDVLASASASASYSPYAQAAELVRARLAEVNGRAPPSGGVVREIREHRAVHLGTRKFQRDVEKERDKGSHREGNTSLWIGRQPEVQN